MMRFASGVASECDGSKERTRHGIRAGEAPLDQIACRDDEWEVWNAGHIQYENKTCILSNYIAQYEGLVAFMHV